MPEQSYFEALLKAYEGEIAGEVYFKTLSGMFTEPTYSQNLLLLAAVEQRTSLALQPLINRHRIEPSYRAELVAVGNSWVTERAFRHWQDLINNMTTHYPGYIEKFKALEAAGPIEDKPALKILVEHEIALLDFAECEKAGDTNSLARVQSFLADY
jgi:hypothetical protein